MMSRINGNMVICKQSEVIVVTIIIVTIVTLMIMVTLVHGSGDIDQQV